MACKQLVNLPKGVNPNGLITVRKAAEVTGIPRTTLYNWKDEQGNGLLSYKVGGRVFFKVQELLRWIDLHAKVKGY